MPRARGRENQNILVKEYRVLVGNDEKVLEMNSDDNYKIIINVLNATEPFKMVKVVNFMVCILFIYLAVMGLACDMRDLLCVM